MRFYPVIRFILKTPYEAPQSEEQTSVLETLKKQTLYEALGVQMTASTKELKAAFNKKAVHPDSGGDPEVFAYLQQAVNTLLNPKKRRAYDSSGRDAVDEAASGQSMLEPFNRDVLEQLIAMKGSSYTICNGVNLRTILLNIRRRCVRVSGHVGHVPVFYRDQPGRRYSGLANAVPPAVTDIDKMVFDDSGRAIPGTEGTSLFSLPADLRDCLRSGIPDLSNLDMIAAHFQAQLKRHPEGFPRLQEYVADCLGPKKFRKQWSDLLHIPIEAAKTAPIRLQYNGSFDKFCKENNVKSVPPHVARWFAEFAVEQRNIRELDARGVDLKEFMQKNHPSAGPEKDPLASYEAHLNMADERTAVDEILNLLPCDCLRCYEHDGAVIQGPTNSEIAAATVASSWSWKLSKYGSETDGIAKLKEHFACQGVDFDTVEEEDWEESWAERYKAIQNCLRFMGQDDDDDKQKGREPTSQFAGAILHELRPFFRSIKTGGKTIMEVYDPKRCIWETTKDYEIMKPAIEKALHRNIAPVIALYSEDYRTGGRWLHYCTPAHVPTFCNAAFKASVASELKQMLYWRAPPVDADTTRGLLLFEKGAVLDMTNDKLIRATPGMRFGRCVPYVFKEFEAPAAILAEWRAVYSELCAFWKAGGVEIESEELDANDRNIGRPDLVARLDKLKEHESSNDIRIMYRIYKNWDRVFYNYKFEAVNAAADPRNEQCMFAAGTGSNGKDTRISRMTALLGKSGEGGFAGTLGKQHFLGKELRDAEAPMPFLESLRGCRWVSVPEVQKNSESITTFNVALLKTLTEKVGGAISVRTLHTKPEPYNVTFGLFFATNDPNVFHELDRGDALERRVIIDYTATRFWKKEEKASDVVVDPSIKIRCAKGEFRAEHLFHLRLAYQSTLAADGREIWPVPEEVTDMTDRYLSGKGSYAQDHVAEAFKKAVEHVSKRALATNYLKVDKLIEGLIHDKKKLPETIQNLGLIKQKSGTLGLGVVYEMIFEEGSAPQPVKIREMVVD